LGFGVWGLGFGVWGLGFGVWGMRFGMWDLGFAVWGWEFEVGGLGCHDSRQNLPSLPLTRAAFCGHSSVEGLEYGVQGLIGILGFQFWGWGLRFKDLSLGFWGLGVPSPCGGSLQDQRLGIHAFGVHGPKSRIQGPGLRVKG